MTKTKGTGGTPLPGKGKELYFNNVYDGLPWARFRQNPKDPEVMDVAISNGYVSSNYWMSGVEVCRLKAFLNEVFPEKEAV